MPVAVGVHHAVCSVKGIELEVILPSGGHHVVIVVLVVHFRTIVPFVTVGVVRDRVGAVLHFFEVRVVLEVIVEALPVRGVRVNVALEFVVSL